MSLTLIDEYLSNNRKIKKNECISQIKKHLSETRVFDKFFFGLTNGRIFQNEKRYRSDNE